MEVSFTSSCPHKFQDPGAILRLSDIVLSTASFPSLGLARWRGWWQIAEDAWETTAGRDVKRCTARGKHVCWCRMSRLPSLMSICFPWRHKSSLLNACSCWKTSFVWWFSGAVVELFVRARRTFSWVFGNNDKLPILHSLNLWNLNVAVGWEDKMTTKVVSKNSRGRECEWQGHWHHSISMFSKKSS